MNSGIRPVGLNIMRAITSTRIRSLGLATLAGVIAGCGGGASDEESAAGTAAAQSGVRSDAVALVLEVPPPTYAPGSHELAAFNRLNEQRGKCGFGLVAQNARIDQAAAAHRTWMVANRALAHQETPGVGFTGVTVADRLLAAGYSAGGYSEGLSGGIWGRKSMLDGATEVQTQLDMPYHGQGALAALRDVGISWGIDSFAMDLAYPRSGFPQLPDGLRTYPCDGSSNILPVLSNELPSPFPNEADPSWGPTVHVFGASVRIAKASITGPTGSVALKAIYGEGASTDPQGHCKGAHACVIPQPLAWGTTYSVHVEGTDLSTPFARDFTFQTAF